jgi:hypothetical protein
MKMLANLGFDSGDVVLTSVLWLCSLPLVALRVVPFFGLKVGAIVALALFFVAIVVCWGVRGWKVFKS